MTGLQPMTVEQQQVVELTARGLPLGEISHATGLSEVRILEARQLGEAWKATGVRVADQAEEPVRSEPEPVEVVDEPEPAGAPVAVEVEEDFDGPPAGPSLESEQAVASPVKAVQPLAAAIVRSITDLLDQANRSKDEDVQAAAQGLLAAVARLKESLAGSEERRVARVAVEVLERQLGEARERLAKLTGVAPAVRVAAARGESDPEPAVVREWAREHGIKVPDRGRIPSNIVTAYRVAHPGAAA
jgi:hypothetical protein